VIGHRIHAMQIRRIEKIILHGAVNDNLLFIFQARYR